MGFSYEFPHSRMFDSDLREIVELINKCKGDAELIKSYIDKYFNNEELKKVIIETIKDMELPYTYIPYLLSTDEDSNVGYPVGKYLIDSDTVIDKNMLIAKGAILIVTEGVTLTINGFIQAGRYPIFEGNGTVIINGNTSVFPEWFGETRNGKDDSIIINKAINALSRGEVNLADGNYIYNPGDLYTQLQGSSYYIENPIIVNKSNIVLSANNRATIIFNTPKAIVLNGEHSFVEQSAIKNILLSYSGLEPFNDDPNNYVAIRVQHVSRCEISNVRICNYCNGISFYKTVNVKVRDVIYDLLRNGNYNAIGFYINSFSGDTSGLSNNASLYIENCLANFSGTTANSKGFIIEGNDCRDIFLLDCEVANPNIGIDIENSGADNNKYSYDIHIKNFIGDLIRECAIKINNVSKYGDISIDGGWLSSGNNDIALINVINSSNVTISNLSLTQNINNSGVGIEIGDTSDGISITNCILTNFSDAIWVKGTKTIIANNIFTLERNNHLIDKAFNNIIKISGGYCTVIANTVITKDGLKYDYLFVTDGSNTNSFVYNAIDSTNATNLWLIDEGNISEGINKK